MRRRFTQYFPLLIVALGIIAYANSFQGVFVLDDSDAIIGNPRIRQLWPQGGGWFTRRAFADMTFALNYATGELSPVDYHATNLGIHLIAALLLYGIVRRTLLLPGLAERFGTEYAPVIAFYSAVIWVAHPLTTASVTYIYQRYESLMGMFYLLMLYCVIRGSIQRSVVPPSSGKAGLRRTSIGQWSKGKWASLWYILAVTACALGMASKEVMITAPVTVWLYDRIFLARSAGDVIRKRWPVYIGFLFCWVLLALLMVFGTSPAKVTGIVFHNIGPNNGDAQLAGKLGYYMEYGLYYFVTQCEVIIHYLRLAFWPNPLCLDYSWPVVNELNDALPSLAFLFLLVVVVLAALWKIPAIGFLGAFFFIVLAPTSSFIPRPDCAFEHRMYLPLIAIVTGFAVAWHDVLHQLSLKNTISKRVRWLLTCVPLCVILGVFSCLTYLRNRDYYSEEAIWCSTVKVSPDNARAHCGLITGLLANGKFVEAESVARRFLDRVNTANQRGSSQRFALPNSVIHFSYHANSLLGRTLLCQGRREEALDYITEAIRVRPESSFAHNCKGVALSQLGRNKEAVEEWLIAVAINPGYGRAHANLARAFEGLGRFQEAVYHYQKAIDSGPGFIPEKFNLAWLLATCPDEDIRDGRKAVELAVSVCETTGYGSAHVMDLLAAAYAEAGWFNDAVRTAQKALNMASKTDGSGLGPDELTGIKRRLQLYQQGKPFRGKKRYPNARDSN